MICVCVTAHASLITMTTGVFIHRQRAAKGSVTLQIPWSMGSIVVFGMDEMC